MNKHLQTIARQTFLIGMFMLCAIAGWSQVYQNGVRKGMVKVKFSADMTASLSSMRISARSGELTTGMEKFDASAKKSKATNMFRLFPYDARYESKLRKHGLHLWYVVEIDSDVDPETAVEQFKQLDEVEVVEVDREKVLAPYRVLDYKNSISPMSTSAFNDPLLKDQWHYENTGQTGFANGADINLFEAWKTTTGSREIIVSIHDQGVDVKHPDLATNIWTNQVELTGNVGVDDDGNGYVDDIHGWNFDKKSGEIDPEFHGTHVAGTIAAVNNNGIGVSGIAGGSGNNDGVRIMSLQSLGGGRIENTYIYAANNGSVISQNSWGYNEPGMIDQSILDAIDYFIAEAGDFPGSPMKGGVVIFAAGNSNWDGDWYPGYYENTISVSSIGPDWKKASYSNYGAWVDIAAPGGEVQLGSKNGVLSTLPNSKYGYLEGTSMACPHVSGVAALILANRTSQLTPVVLWTKLLTGVTDIDSHNPDYAGKLGSGMLDANLAIQNNAGIAPDAILDLSIVGISQEFATLTWKVPADQDDVQPVNFRVLVHDKVITASNISEARQIVIVNKSAVGESINYSVEGLLGQTQYYFAVLSTDRWNNISALSNGVSGSTNAGPAIAVDENSQEITLNIDIATGTTANHEITISNNAAGMLRWNYFTRHKSTELSFSSAGLKYPLIKNTKIATLGKVGSRDASTPKPAATISPMSFEEVEKRYTDWSPYIIGEDDLSLTNSSATKFYVNDENGFNLTRARAYLHHNPELGPVILEVYKGASINKQSLVHAQEYTAWGDYEHTAYIDLTEQLYFQKGETFWIVIHVPAGNKWPLGIGWEKESQQSDYCFMSFDLGKTWAPLHEVLTGKPNKETYVWSTVAVSSNPYLGEYITLNPSSGEVTGNENGATTLSVDASTLINGTYNANVILSSNDAVNKELRIPVTVNVSGQAPQVSSIETLDFSSVFQGASKELIVTISNSGLGNYSDATFEITNPQFKIVGWPPSQIKAKEEITLTVKYTPNVLGNDNGMLRLTSSSNPKTLNVILFGVSAPPAAITVTPLSQTINNLTIGDAVTATVTVENTGQAALKYFVPGFDQSDVSENWTSDYHSYGYKFRTSYEDEANPLAYVFQDISSTGVNISGYFRAEDNRYWEVDMGFTFPYYKDSMTKLYVSSRGFTTFSPDVRPVNYPTLNNPYNPKGYISMLGQYTDLSAGGEILYQVEPDRVIVQYNAIGDSWAGFNTAQMVLYADGNIRFYYENIGQSSNNITVLIEDFDQTDGILINGIGGQTPIYSGLALGFDYPGPDIITSITNGGGILMPGETAELEIVMNTSTIAEGQVNRFVNIISNDPMKSQETAEVKLSIVNGGVADVTISTNDISFGDVFQGANVSRKFSMKNNGTAAVTLTNVTLDNSSFIINGNTSATIKPGLSVLFEVVLPTGTKTNLTDLLHITDSEGTEFIITLSGNVVDAPAIVTDLTPIVLTLAHGETSSHPISFENAGLADLEVVATGNQWLTMKKNLGPSSTPNYTYTSKLYNDGTNYQWLDIRKTGEHLPFLTTDEEFWDPKKYWREFELPRPISFYGTEYSTIYIAENGVISFKEQDEISLFFDDLPTENDFGAVLAPFWAWGGFNTVFYPAEEVGIFVQHDDEKIVVSWEYLIDGFSMGDPLSVQVIFYNNGTMKFQYKVNGSIDDMSNDAIIGMQSEDKSDVVKINVKSNLTHGSGLAFIVTPAEKHVVAPGTILNAMIEISAANVYAGTYSDGLTIRTNVPNMESLFKPVELTVTGEAAISVPESIDFGSIMAVETSQGPASYSREFSIRNTGVADLSFSGINIQSFAPEYIVEMYVFVYDPLWGGYWSWSDVNWLWEWPVVKPGDELKMRITSMPTTAGVIEENLAINSSLGESIVPILGTVVIPPVLSVNTESVYSEVTNLTDTDTKIISIDNEQGQSDLTYTLSIDYNRTIATSLATVEKMATEAGPSILKSVKATSNIHPLSTQTTFNRVLAHENASIPSSYLGYGGQYDFRVATKFNAGVDGFNVTHIQAFYRAPEATTGTVDYEVRAGGSDISQAKILSQGTYTYSYGGGENGEWLEIPLTTSATVYPNEDFYIIVNYPMVLEFPQGYIENAASATDRYQYFYEGVWHDIQEGYAGAGFLMRAAEETFVSNSWVSIQGATEGTIEPGASLGIQLDFKASFGERGDQFATLVINTNDPVNPTGEIPITFHINAGPQFIEVPPIVRINEGATKTVTIQILDKEEHSFTIAPKQIYPGVNYSVTGAILTITLTPDYEAAGTYAFIFEGTDVIGAQSSMTLNVEVLNVNRKPVFIGEDAMTFNATGKLNEYSIGDYFSDPDGDEFTFTLINSNTEATTVFISENGFLIRPMEIGTSNLMFTATDVHGAVTKDTIEVTVDVVLGSEDDLANNGAGVYPNPVKTTSTVTFSNGWSGDVTITILDAAGKQHITKQADIGSSREVTIDASMLRKGFYVLHAESNNRHAVIKLIKD